jgi:hypothetical protein
MELLENEKLEKKISIYWDNQSLTSYSENYKFTEYIRNKYNIIAEAIGTPKTARKQNKTLTKPFILNKFETFYLLEMYNYNNYLIQLFFHKANHPIR